jgi:hypothetical protein
MPKKAKVEGEVAIRDNNSVLLEWFEREIVLDDSVKTLEEARRIIKRGLLVEEMKKTIPNFKRIRTCQVVSFEDTSDLPDSSELTKLLTEATKLNCLPENLQNYRKEEDKIRMLASAIEKSKAKAKKKPARGEETDLGYVD